MATFSRSTTVNYTGTIMEGAGVADAGTGAFSLPVSFPKRIGDPAGVTSPEELISAAHAACYAMVITGALGRASASTTRTSVKCTVTADKGDAGIKITNSRLELTAEGLTGMDAAAFEKMAREADSKCPVSNLLRCGLAIDVTVTVK
jgi:osmotically inducible protein OsmC